MSTIRKAARLFRAGNYPDKGIDARGDFLDRVIAATGQAAPLDIEHGPTERVLKFGQLVAGSLHRDGEWLMGAVDIDSEIDQRLLSRGLSVQLNRATGAITKLAVTATPRVVGAAFSDGDTDDDPETIVFAGGELMGQEETTVQTGGAETSGVDEKVPGWFANFAARFKTDPEAAVSEEVTFGADDVRRIAEEAAATASAETEKRLRAEFADKLTPLNSDRVSNRIAAEVAAGVPRFTADRLVPFTCGAETVSFSNDQGEVQSLTFAQVAEELLTAARGTTNGEALFGASDRNEDINAEAQFSADVTKVADTLKATHPDMDQVQLLDLAVATVKGGK